MNNGHWLKRDRKAIAEAIAFYLGAYSFRSKIERLVSLQDLDDLLLCFCSDNGINAMQLIYKQRFEEIFQDTEVKSALLN